MSYRPPESDTDHVPEPVAGPTDFASLMAGGVADRVPPRERVATDFRSLRAGAFEPRRRYQSRTITDWLVDSLTPLMIFAMVYAFLFFLLDVRHVYLGLDATADRTALLHDRVLHWVAMFFVVGIVALNRLITRDGREESILYILGLTGAVALYTFSTTSEIGSMAGNFMNSPYLATLFNVFLVAFIWWVVNRLTHECCVDSNPTAGDVGILTGTAMRLQSALRGKPGAPAPKRAAPQPVILANELEPFDPSETRPTRASAAQPPPERVSARLPRRHPGISVFYVSVPVMIAFAAGQRVLLDAPPILRMRAHGFIVAYTIAALALLMLSSLGGLREYFRSRRIEIPGGIGPFWIGLGAAMMVLVVLGAARLPAPALPGTIRVAQPTAPLRHGEPGEYDRAAEHGQGQNTRQGAPDQRVENGPDVAAPEAREGQAPADDGQQQGGQEGRNGARTDPQAPQQPWRNPAIDMPELGGFTRHLGMAVMIIMGIFGGFVLLRALSMLAFALANRRGHGSGALRRLFAALDRLLQRLTRLPALPRPRRRVRVDRAIAVSAQYRNPLRDATMSPAEMVQYSYAALCALAHDMAAPRRDDQTPFEFIETFPEPLRTLRDDAEDLTQLYVLSAYSNLTLEENVPDRLRRFWRQYERVRGAALR